MFRLISLVLGIGFLVGLVVSGSYVFDTYLLGPDDDVESVDVLIESGSSVDAIGRLLEEKEIISSTFFFKVYVRLNDSMLQAGEFEFVPGMSIRSAVKTMAYAEASEVQVTLPEGMTIKQMGDVVVEAMPGISEEDWGNVVGANGKYTSSSAFFLSGIPAGYDLEGYLFPDTYRFRENTSAQVVVDTMVSTLKRRLAESGVMIPESGVVSNGLDFHELITLASIVQREVLSIDDMKLVAGIFYSRMKIGMALQADSTVNYVTGKKDAAITLEDSFVESKYNTYRNLGLPPGPISNPGLDAILAVVNPEDSEYLYFLTDLEGNVHYAATFDQHISNKYKYLK
jgi:UPF0755 protein